MTPALQALALFAVFLLLGRVLGGADGLAEWQRTQLGAPYVTALATFAGLSAVALLRWRPRAEATGLTARQPARWLEIGCMSLAVLGPVGGSVFGLLAMLGWSPQGLGGGVLLTAAYLMCLPLLMLFLRRTRKVESAAHPATPTALLTVLVLTFPLGWALATMSVLAAQTLHVLVVVGLGEELFYRGVLYERLDRAVPGRGWLLQAPLFGASHVLLAPAPVEVLGWGLWTTAAGLCFGWLRRRSGTVLAPALAHGVLDLVGLVLVPRLLGG